MIAQALIVLSVLALFQPVVQAEPTVVFVCEHGAAKSVIATAYFNKIAAEKGLRARAIYRGVNPQADLSVSALKGLRDDGLTTPDLKPSAIAPADVVRLVAEAAPEGREDAEAVVRIYCADAFGGIPPGAETVRELDERLRRLKKLAS